MTTFCGSCGRTSSIYTSSIPHRCVALLRIPKLTFSFVFFVAINGCTHSWKWWIIGFGVVPNSPKSICCFSLTARRIGVDSQLIARIFTDLQLCLERRNASLFVHSEVFNKQFIIYMKLRACGHRVGWKLKFIRMDLSFRISVYLCHRAYCHVTYMENVHAAYCVVSVSEKTSSFNSIVKIGINCCNLLVNTNSVDDRSILGKWMRNWEMYSLRMSAIIWTFEGPLTVFNFSTNRLIHQIEFAI